MTECVLMNFGWIRGLDPSVTFSCYKIKKKKRNKQKILTEGFLAVRCIWVNLGT